MWSIKYAPKTIEECVLTPEHKKLFSGFIKKGSIPNLLLVGDAGLGKTTIAKILSDACEFECYEVNASLDAGLDKLRTEFVGFASSVSMFGQGKVILFDEADYIRKPSQAALRGMIDKFSGGCSFILTANYEKKLLDPIKSRLHVIRFGTDDASSETMKAGMVKRIRQIAKSEGVRFNSKMVEEAVNDNFPDLRSAINAAELALA
jgi:DNA polymerase III delta prime subunit